MAHGHLTTVKHPSLHSPHSVLEPIELPSEPHHRPYAAFELALTQPVLVNRGLLRVVTAGGVALIQLG